MGSRFATVQQLGVGRRYFAGEVVTVVAAGLGDVVAVGVGVGVAVTVGRMGSGQLPVFSPMVLISAFDRGSPA
ncbi:hypothetical protein [Nocardia sp. NPDC049149]|uniref:hypothetical protein n=1 Tax=Nocardia sp. NPDC049149 TaxID=3364315 RepID=UPI00371CCECD